MRSFANINPRETSTSLSFTDAGKSWPSREFLTSQTCILMLFTKIRFSVQLVTLLPSSYADLEADMLQ